MKNLFRTLSTTFLLATLMACSKEASVAPVTPTTPTTPVVPVETQRDLTEIDGILAAFMSKYNIPGASLAIAKDGKLVYRKAYGLADKETKTPVTIDSKFRLASVSKVYTGVAIMKLIEAGKFKIDDRVFGDGGLLGTTYGSKPYPADFKKVTVRHLLNMTSGGFFTNTNPDPIGEQPELNNKEYFDWLMDNAKLASEPGSQYHYVNTNFWIAGRIIEKFSGKSYLSYLKDELLQPIGPVILEQAKSLKNQRYENEVTYYEQGPIAGYEYGFNIARYDATGGLVSTATDLLRFVSAIDGLATRPDILSKASLDLLTTPSTANQNFGLGIGVWKELNLLYSYGTLPGTRTGFIRHDNGMSVSLLLNGTTEYYKPAVFTPFEYAMQDMLLDIVNKPQRAYQAIDQF